MNANTRLAWLLSLPPRRRLAQLKRLNDSEKRELRHHWRLWAQIGQAPPPGKWRIWLIMAGRGYGKTRAGAEWIREIAQRDPEARIALVAASLGEARSVMVEGESGLLAIAPRGRRPKFEPSLRRLTWPGGAQATLYSAGEPESLRGPQHSHALRAGAEGVLRQRSDGPGRSAAARCNRGRDCGAAHIPRRRPNMDCRGIAHRIVRRSRPVFGGLDRGWLALRRSPERSEGIRQGKCSISPLSRRLAAPDCAFRSGWGADHRYRGSRRHHDVA